MAQPPARSATFRTTRWSLVIAAGRRGDDGQRALAELCELYWPPVFAFLWRKTGDRERAADLTQGLFAELLAREDFGKADPERGRFRSFLRKCAQNFAAKEYAGERAKKRGGGELPLSLEALRCSDGEPFPIADFATPEAAFERRWATTLLDRVMGQLAAEYAGRGRAEVFAALQAHLETSDEGESCSVAKARLRGLGIVLSETAIRVTVHRMRQRFASLLTAEIAQTLGADADPQEELADLRAALRGNARKPGAVL